MINPRNVHNVNIFFGFTVIQYIICKFKNELRASNIEGPDIEHSSGFIFALAQIVFYCYRFESNNKSSLSKTVLNLNTVGFTRDFIFKLNIFFLKINVIKTHKNLRTSSRVKLIFVCVPCAI